MEMANEYSIYEPRTMAGIVRLFRRDITLLEVIVVMLRMAMGLITMGHAERD